MVYQQRRRNPPEAIYKDPWIQIEDSDEEDDTEEVEETTVDNNAEKRSWYDLEAWLGKIP
jgi:hypothetical protein